MKLENVVIPLPEEIIIQYKWISDYLEKQTYTEKVFQSVWQAYKYLLRGKMYAYIGVEDKTARPILTLKLEPTYSDVLRKQFADIVPGYYMNKIFWSTVYLDGDVPEDVMKLMIESSYKEITKTFSQKIQRALFDDSSN